MRDRIEPYSTCSTTSISLSGICERTLLPSCRHLRTFVTCERTSTDPARPGRAFVHEHRIGSSIHRWCGGARLCVPGVWEAADNCCCSSPLMSGEQLWHRADLWQRNQPIGPAPPEVRRTSQHTAGAPAWVCPAGEQEARPNGLTTLGTGREVPGHVSHPIGGRLRLRAGKRYVG